MTGLYPVETVETVAKISRAAEKVFDDQMHADHLWKVSSEGTRLEEVYKLNNREGSVGGDSEAEEDEGSQGESNKMI